MNPISSQIIELMTKCETLEWCDEIFECIDKHLKPITYMHFCSVIVLLKQAEPNEFYNKIS